MNKKLLCAALMAGLGVAQAASAQSFDDRWYVTTSAGLNLQDGDRGTSNTPFGTLGFGKFVSPEWSIDGEFNYQNPSFDNQGIVRPRRTVPPGVRAGDFNWSQYGLSLDVRRHFIEEGRSWNPYAVFGLGYQRSEEEYDVYPSTNAPGEREDGNLAGKIGIGAQGDIGRVYMRTELAYRIDNDDSSVNGGGDNSWFGDVLASVGFVIPLGPEAVEEAPAPAPTPAPAPNCADQDSDGDGVNNCVDKCPNSQAGQAIGDDGCPAQIVIDLKGVNFDYDKATLRPDSVAILNEAAEILKRYPELRVEVAGHTDSKGSDSYNQSLSERRAKAVYDYLVKNGVDAGRMSGPNGYGETRPIAPNTNADGSDNPEGRAKNRRTELNVQQ